MHSDDQDVIIPLIQEEVHVDAVPVVTGGVRITKHFEQHQEFIQQQLRKGRVQIQRIKTERIVDGPEQPYQSGNTLIIPIVSEVPVVKTQWVVTEELHVTQLEETESVQQAVSVGREHAQIERLNEYGEVVSVEDLEASLPPLS